MDNGQATPGAAGEYSNADFIRYAAGEPGAAPPPVAPSAPGPAAPAAPDGSLLNLGVSAAQLRSALDYEVSGGRLSRAEADAMLAQELGVHPDAVRAAVAAEGGDEVTQWLADAGFPPAKAHELTLPKFPGANEASPADLLAMDRQVRDIVTQAKLPLGIGNYLVGEIAKGAEVYGSLDAASRDRLQHQARAELQRVWGAETQEMLEGASDLAHELERRCPGFFDLMDRTGAGDNPRVIVQLAEHARRLRGGLAEREARRAGR